MVHDFQTNALLDPPTNPDAVEIPSNYLICQRSGFRVSVAEGLVADGEKPGLLVRKQDYDKVHPQRFVRARPETDRKGSPSPEQPVRFV